MINFKDLLRQLSEPVLIKNGVEHWQALEKWTWSYLATLAGNRQVRLVKGNREQHQTCFVHMALSDYIHSLTNSEFSSSQEPLYLKEFDLFQEFPTLQDDVDYTDFFPNWVTPVKAAWIGPKTAMTGLHYDIFHNFLIQVAGDKEIWFYPQAAIPMEYRSDKFDYGARDAKVNMFEMDLKKFPKLKDVHPRVEFVSAGDVVLIPKGWWHQVRALSPTITIANFMVRTRDRFTIEAWENTRRFFHIRGLYKVENCTCHSTRVPFNLAQRS
jgi:ribosomal protein L16 Arg81 hydroxylase